MLKTAAFTVAIILCALISGCKYDCEKADIDIDLISFTDTEMDDVVISKFTKGSNFSLVVETATVTRGNQHYPRRTDTILFPPVYFSSGGHMTADFDYEVNVVKVGKTFRITEIVEEQRTKNKKGDVLCINPVTSYKVNGQLITGVNWDPFYLKK